MKRYFSGIFSDFSYMAALVWALEGGEKDGESVSVKYLVMGLFP